MNFARYGIINAQKYPDKEYLIERKPSEKKRRSLTWKEFNENTNKVAHYLQKQMGFKKGDFVLHLQMNSLEWIVTFHAILREAIRNWINNGGEKVKWVTCRFILVKCWPEMPGCFLRAPHW